MTPNNTQMKTNPDDLIHWKNWNPEEIRDILHLAENVQADPLAYAQSMRAKTLVMLFQKTSTRTRVSFEAGMTEMGGHAIYLDWQNSNFGLTRTEYEAAYLSSNAHLIMARVKEHQTLIDLQKGSLVPVINGCCDQYHPCQGMADFLTLKQDAGELKGLRLSYLGVFNNVVNTLVSLSLVFGVELTLACPIRPQEDVDWKSLEALKAAGLLTETLDPKEAVKNADYVYTDTWVNMEHFNDPKSQHLKDERVKLMIDYQLNHKLLAGSKAKVMHDMPIHPGYEISDELVADPRSIIFAQAKNRLVAQKAIMLRLLKQA